MPNKDNVIYYSVTENKYNITGKSSKIYRTNSQDRYIVTIHTYI